MAETGRMALDWVMVCTGVLSRSLKEASLLYIARIITLLCSVQGWLGLSSAESDEVRIAEQEDLDREQEQLNLIARRGEEVLASAPALPPLQRQRSGKVLPCVCCPSSPALVAAACPGLPASPTWEQVEGGAIVLLLTLLLWGVLWALLGPDAGPLSAPFYVIMMSLAGHAVGTTVSTLTPLPPMYGMLLLPAIAGNLDIRELEVLALLRGDTAALIVFASMGVFIARAGIDVELLLLQSSSGMVLALGFLPLFAETAFVTVAATYALDIPWRWAFLLGSLTAPMSPLVVMWTALDLRRTTLGSGGSVCSLLLVVCALDSAAAFCIFGIALQCAADSASWSSIATAFFQLPAGILIGAVIGFMSIYVPNEYNVHATFYRVEMLLAVNVCSVITFHYFLGMPAVGYLSAFTTACVASNGWKTLSMDSNKNTLRTMMSLSWLILQPLAMSIVGPHMFVLRLAGWRQLRYIGVLLCGVAVRMIVSALCCVKSKRPWAERFFICIACVPKGTVQLLTCSWTLFRGFTDEQGQAMSVLVLDCCVYAMLLTGPLGALLSSSLAPRLLQKHTSTESLCERQEPDMSF